MTIRNNIINTLEGQAVSAPVRGSNCKPEFSDGAGVRTILSTSNLCLRTKLGKA